MTIWSPSNLTSDQYKTQSSTEKEKSNRTVLYNALSTMSINQLLLYMQKHKIFRHVYNLGYADDTTHMAESEELKSLLMKVRGEWKSWLKTQHSEN